jgi:O-antigen ligase
LLAVATILLTGSRGGLVFGLLEFALLIIYFAVKDKQHRKLYLTVTGIAVLLFLCLIPKWADFLDYTLERFTDMGENTIRLGLWKRSVEDFLSNPLTGRGLGYMGNRDLHKSATAALCWYHSTVPQIIGSFGIVGILSFAYQYYRRIRFFLSKRSLFSKTVLFSWIGLEMMSLVNPGIFAPVYLLCITVLFVIVENYEVEV